MSRILGGGGRLGGRMFAAVLGALGIANSKVLTDGRRTAPTLHELVRGRKRSPRIETPNAMKFRYRTQNWKPGQQGARECARRVRQMERGVLNYENGVDRSVNLASMRMADHDRTTVRQEAA